MKPLAVIIWLLLSTMSAFAGVFDINGKQPTRMTVISDPTFDLPDSTPSSWMLGVTQGVIHELEREEMLALRAAARGSKPAKPHNTRYPFARIRMSANKDIKDILIERDDRGVYYAHSEQDHADCVRLDPARTRRLFSQWPRYRGTATIAPGTRFGTLQELSAPYVQGVERSTSDELRTRLLRGRPTQLDDSTRLLEDERFFVRLPLDYKPDEATALVVWIQAGTGDAIPTQLYDWLDRSRSIAVTARNIGNSRQVVDRYQIAFDMVSTISARYIIDETRVYVGGISGGARVACHLWMGWPETFKGVLPVVGISFFDPIDGFDGKKYSPDFDKPEDTSFAIVSRHPLAAISGTLDFNYPHIAPCVERMRLVGLQARLFESPERAHEMAPSEIVTTALTFVDSPAAANLKSKRETAAQLLSGDGQSGTARREVLIRVTEIAPWTPESLEAARILAALEADDSTK